MPVDVEETQDQVDQAASALLMFHHRRISQAIAQRFDTLIAGLADDLRNIATEDGRVPEVKSWGDVAAQVYCREQNGE